MHRPSIALVACLSLWVYSFASWSLEPEEPQPEPTPAAPASVTVPSSSNTADFTLSWSSVSGSNYSLWREEKDGVWDVSWTMAADGITSVGLTERANGNYRYQVKACHLLATPACSNETMSNMIAVSTLLPPGVLPSISLPAQNPDVDGSFSISWAQASGEVAYYEGRIQRDGIWPSNWANLGLNTTFLFSEQADGDYYYEVRACNAAGCGASRVSAKMTVERPASGEWANTGGGEPVDAAWNGDTVAPFSDFSVGAVQGAGGVSGGAASYSISVVSPPGRAGMQPSVDLSYSSRAGNGLVGMGWSISSGSAVSRCSKTSAQDKYARVVSYDNDDAMCLDGKRLIEQVDNTVSATKVYRFELDNFTRVLQHGTLDNSASYFVVQHKNGHISHYGNRVDARHLLGGLTQVSSWALTQEADTTGNNVVRYYYTNYGSGENHLSKITYTGDASSDGDREIRFVMEPGVRPDLSEQYQQGGLSRQTKRLQQIETYSQGTKVRQYSLTYKLSDATKRSLLTSVTECAYQSGTSYCLPASNIAWNDQVIDFQQSLLDMSSESSFDTVDGDKVSISGDYDGDGRRDLVLTNIDMLPINGAYYPSISHKLNGVDANGQLKASSELDGLDNDAILELLEDPTQHRLSADFNSDGKVDFIGQNSTTLTRLVGHLDNGSFNWIDTGASTFSRMDADYDQDGLVDMLGFGSGDQFIFYRNCSTASTLTFCAGQVVHTLASTGILDFEQQDFNGDGLPDIVVKKRYVIINGTQEEYRIEEILLGQRSGGTVSFTSVTPASLNIADIITSTPTHKSYRTFADITGDGLPDRIIVKASSANDDKPEFSIQRNTGTSFLATETFTGQVEDALLRFTLGAIRIVDYDSDGVSELLVPSIPDGQYCYEAIVSPGGNTEPGEIVDGIESACLPSAGRPSVYKWARYSLKLQSNLNWSLERADTNIYGSLDSLQTGDLFGDGKTEIFSSVGKRHKDPSDGVMTGYYDNKTTVDGVVVYQNSNESTDMLASVTTGLGVESKWHYAPISVDSTTATCGSQDIYSTTHVPAGYTGAHYFFNSSMYVVAEYEQSNGVGGDNSQCYYYKDAIFNHQGRGFQGFRSITVDSVAHGRRSVSDFHQRFPLSGQLEQSLSCLIDSNTQGCASDKLINKTTYVWDLWRDGVNKQTVNDANDDFSAQMLEKNISANRYAVVSNSQTEQSFSTSSGYNGVSAPVSVSSELLYTTHSSSMVDSCGNVTSSSSSYFEGSEQNPINKTASSTQASYVCDESNWWLNKLTSQTVTSEAVHNQQSSSLTDFASIAANTDFQKQTQTDYSYDPITRLPVSVTSQALTGASNAAGLSSTVTTQYNAHGLPTLITTVGDSYQDAPMDSRSVTNSYSADGYFISSVTNVLGHTTSTVVDPTHGQALSVTDANGQVAQMSYDAFGRVRSQKAPGEPTVWTSYRWCNGVQAGGAWCYSGAPYGDNSRYRVSTEQLGSPLSYSYHDKANRALFNQTSDFDGTGWYRTWTQYNGLGQKEHEAVLDDGNGSWQYSYYDAYDSLGRMAKKRSPQANGGYMETLYGYDGFVTTVKVDEANGAGTLSMERKYNGLGQLVYTKDAIGGYSRYAYDGAGNPVTLQDANGGKITARYNALGHKEWVDDPNMGLKSFKYNALGELEWEQDANGDVQTYRYDRLGRMDRRWSNGDFTGYWRYDSTASNGRLGMLDYEWNSNANNNQDRLTKYYRYGTTTSGKDYLSYSLHRVFEEGVWQDFQVVNYVDNHFGRPKGTKYTTTGLTLAYDYNDRGYMTKVKNANGGYVYQEITNLDGQGKVSSQLMANGLMTQTATYHKATGQMTDITMAMSAGGQEKHKLNYVYNGFGNLISQSVLANNASLNVEHYQYDNLHRLVHSSRIINNGANNPAPITYSYDAVGNFLSKSDYASNYVYNGVGIERKASNGFAGSNAVRSVTKNGASAAIEFTYDKNGNRTLGDGKDITYNVFNKPSLIKNTSSSVEVAFSYGADWSRYKQIKSGLAGGKQETSYYVDKALEKIVTTTNGNVTKTQYKHYIGDVAIQTQTIENATTNWTLGYVHRDRLGSVVTVTDHNGQVQEHRSYDPFGKPRQGDFIDSLPATISAAVGIDPITDRGFTDHEHLDEVELIHMNGRAYDYNLGRFLSVDPFVQAPGNSQSMNPYSYIMNNPLSGADPSGYSSKTDKDEQQVTTMVNVGDKYFTDKKGNVYLEQDDGSAIKVDSGSINNSAGANQAAIGGNESTNNSKSGLTYRGNASRRMEQRGTGGGNAFNVGEQSSIGDDFSQNHFRHSEIFGDNTFDPTDSTFHHYDTITDVCTAGTNGCSYETLNEVLTKFSYPAKWLQPTDAALDGHPVVAYAVNPMLDSAENPLDYDVPVGRVRQIRLNSGGIQNITLRDHAVYNGTISRHIIERNGKLAIWTHGIGINRAIPRGGPLGLANRIASFINHKLAKGNDIYGPKAFIALDNQAIKYWNNNYAK